MSAAQIISILAGGVIAAGTFWSAIVTVVVPRARRPGITRIHYRIVGLFATGAGRLCRSREQRDQLESRVAPLALVTLPAVWAGHLVVGFALIYWGLDHGTFRQSLALSGSSLTTLGVRNASGLSLGLVVVEALIGLGIVALMITYLPTIYSSFLEREVAVARLEVRAGRPPHPFTFLVRSHQIGLLDQVDTTWVEWEDWFLHIEETHTTHSSLPFFRSAYYGRSWLVAAGTVLDAASFIHAVVDVPRSPQAALCIRSGFASIRAIADMFGIGYPPDPVQGDPISLPREVFDEFCDAVEAEGLSLRRDREQAWLDFAGWRVNYDAALLGLMTRLRIDPGAWFGDQRARPLGEI